MYYNLKKVLFLISVTLYPYSTIWAKCNLPKTLIENPLILRVSPLYSKNNPNASELMKLTFNKDGKYTNNYLTNGKKYEGSYTYKEITKSTALISAKENFEGKVTYYELWIHCMNNISGHYVYRQEDGAITPQVRSNTGEYSVLGSVAND